MNKYFKILLFLGFLWLASYGVSALFFSEEGIASGDQILVIPVEGMLTFQGEGSLLSSSSSGLM